jgi:hypothetical protein
VNHPFSVAEVRCPACGHPNFPPAQAWRRTRATRYCGQCGANLSTGERDAGTLVHHHGALAAAFVLSALIGAFAGMLVLQFLAWALFAGTHFARLAPHGWLAGMVLGAAAGIALVERNRRRGGFSGPKTAQAAVKESNTALVFIAAWFGGMLFFMISDRLRNSPGFDGLAGLVGLVGLAWLVGGLVYALHRARRDRKPPPGA